MDAEKRLREDRSPFRSIDSASTKGNTVFPLSQYCYQTQGTPKGPFHPVARATPYPEVTEQFCRLPSHAFSCLTRGCSPWRPAAVVGTDENQSCVSPRDFSRLVSRTSDNAWLALVGRGTASEDTRNRRPPEGGVLSLQSTVPLSG